MRNQIKLRCDGPKTEILVNNLRLDALKDDSHKRGSISLVISGEAGMFDQIELTSWRRDAAIKMRNEITVRCVGPRIDLYINAIRVADFKDESHKSGRITLVFSGGLGSFDDLIIKRLKQ